MNFIIFGILAYLLGSIPTAVWLGNIKYGIDVREHGSKNAGATNTFRVLGKKPGIIVLIIDIIKGVLASLLPHLILMNKIPLDEVIEIQIVSSILAVFGHVFPLFANFKGGKGVATSLGVIIGLHPAAAGLCLSIFLIVFISSNYVSLGAIIAALFFPFILFFVFHQTLIWLTIFSILLSFAVILAHRKNIGRLLKGEENKMRLFKRT